MQHPELNVVSIEDYNLVTDDSYEVKITHPDTLGWLEKKLNDTEMNHLWECIANKKEDWKGHLAGNISASYKLLDKNNWFWANTLRPLCLQYAQVFKNLGEEAPISQRHPYYLETLWVNYQKQTEFNPLHTHGGVYSFVIWMKIPTKYSEQAKNPIALGTNSKSISNFNFVYADILGERSVFKYEMSPDMEGQMLFFPAKLEHQVFPFYNCDETRISVAGNILLDTAQLLTQEGEGQDWPTE